MSVRSAETKCLVKIAGERQHDAAHFTYISNFIGDIWGICRDDAVRAVAEGLEKTRNKGDFAKFQASS